MKPLVYKLKSFSIKLDLTGTKEKYLRTVWFKMLELGN